MSEYQLSLNARTIVGKKLAGLRAEDQIPSVVYGGQNNPINTQSAYNETEKVLHAAGYHSPVDLIIDGKKQMAIIKNVDLDPRSRKILNVEFQAVSEDEVVTATTPIMIVGFEGSPASKLRYTLLQVMEEIEIKAKPSELPASISADASQLKELDDRLTISDLDLPQGVELADKEIDSEQIVASIYDPAAEAAAREAEDAKAAEESVDAADVPSDNGSKPSEEEVAE